MKGSNRVGIRELRQNLSVYLRRVQKGQILEVTARGKSVALLTPTRENLTALQRLIASGRALAPAGDLLDLPPPRRFPGKRLLSEILQEMRDEEAR